MLVYSRTAGISFLLRCTLLCALRKHREKLQSWAKCNMHSRAECSSSYAMMCSVQIDVASHPCTYNQYQVCNVHHYVCMQQCMDCCLLLAVLDFDGYTASDATKYIDMLMPKAQPLAAGIQERSRC